MNEQALLAVIKALTATETTTETPAKQKHLIGQDVIVRCRDAGVHFGKLVNYEGREVILRDARRMYYWVAQSGHTLSGCAIDGITSDSKITGEVAEIVLTEACEIIACTEKAARSLRDVAVYQPS